MNELENLPKPVKLVLAIVVALVITLVFHWFILYLCHTVDVKPGWGNVFVDVVVLVITAVIIIGTTDIIE